MATVSSTTVGGPRREIAASTRHPTDADASVHLAETRAASPPLCAPLEALGQHISGEPVPLGAHLGDSKGREALEALLRLPHHGPSGAVRR